MGKSTFFTGQPIFNQLLSFIPQHIVRSSVSKHDSDRYYKTFRSYDHLVTMLYTCFQQCKSLREVVTGMMASHHRLQHLRIQAPPRRSTLSEANNRRSELFFSSVYSGLIKHYGLFLPDSRIKGRMEQRLFLMDSTTIKLFSDIMQGAGTQPVNGKKKGGAKVHMLVKASDDLPVFATLTHAKKNDKEIFRHLQLPKGAIVVFDKGYNSYEQFDQWNRRGITWVTRMSDVASQELVRQNEVPAKEQQAGVIADDWVILGRPSNANKTKRIRVRRITFLDAQSGKTFYFITSHRKFRASVIAALYKRRWQIELLFKRFKHNYPLRYFLGESENAIRIQIWCSLITDLLLSLVKKRVKKSWSFANIAAMVRLHLMNYISLYAFLENPEKALRNYTEPIPKTQLSLFNSS